MGIPIQRKVERQLVPTANPDINKGDKLVFSFSAVERNEYFNLDGTCQNWASDLFGVLQIASEISIKDIYARKYTGSSSPLRIHQHLNVKKPCVRPQNVELEDMWQIRLGKSKGGIHGIFVENIFYVIWFDPHHNLYPDENYGGLKKITPPSTCCKERDRELHEIIDKYRELEENYKAAEELLNAQ